MTVLLREAIGDRLRHARTTQHRSLREVSRAARVSLGYLSEVERGRKEASSELLAAICDALELPLADLLSNVAADVRAVDEVTAAPAAASVPAGFAIGGQNRGDGKQHLQGGRMVPAVVGNDLADLRIQPVLSPRLSTTITPPKGVVVAA
ncbi:MAG TPA: helix-turn-helix transcriptional regulator [Pseudonocardiaceae bacterium]|nr:helix-turn-helix transcriptional regulator [Pseudonocardiaceae bacterium]